MTTGDCCHLPGSLCDCPGSAALSKSVEDSDIGRPQYITQVTAKDGRLLSTVIKALGAQSDGPICRICHEGGNGEGLLSPCDCTGTLGTVHKSCLEKWLSSSNTSYCELCHTEFVVERRPRPLTEKEDAPWPFCAQSRARLAPGRPAAPPQGRRGGMAASARFVLFLCVGWGCLCPALGDALRPRRAGLWRRAAPGTVRAGHARTPAGDHGPGQRWPGQPPAAEDRVAEHMLRLYEQYRGSRGPPTPAGLWLRRGNTVRGFRPLPAGTPEGQEMYVFNLTSLTESENVLSASVYYYIGDLLHVKWNCSQSSGCSHRRHRKPEIQIGLSVWTFPSEGNPTRSWGHFLINFSSDYQDILSWQWKDITQLLHEAKQNNELLMSIKIDLTSQHPWEKASSSYKPYILIYANDSAISEPESVVSTLQGHHQPLARVLPKPESHMRSNNRRRKRSANIMLPLQNNELPGAKYQYSEDERWEGRKPYKTFQPQLADRARSKKKQRKNHLQKTQTLQFDEQTLKKARRKQWNKPRFCTRRYLKVDFADIGWSEWIISPKSFDAYYCSGECQFPIPKAMKPSNHATIQSIVRAVGVVPGIPEPCCVPDKMSSLSILFFDENKNVVLKVYPNMTVESCACK